MHPIIGEDGTSMGSSFGRYLSENERWKREDARRCRVRGLTRRTPQVNLLLDMSDPEYAQWKAQHPERTDVLDPDPDPEPAPSRTKVNGTDVTLGP